jgi:hypothetical protein
MNGAPHRLHLPVAYLHAFHAAPIPGESGRHVWAFRAAIGEWKRWPVEPPTGPDRHFNDAGPGAPDRPDPLWEELVSLLPRVAPLLGDGLAAERRIGPEERSSLARFLGVAGVRNARHGAELAADEALAGASSLAAALGEMGWVFWVAEPGDYFIGSSSPLHVAFPKEDASQTTGFDVTAPQVEVTFALSPRVALHATWRRRDELWRRSRQEVTLEINGRTCAGASAYLFSPQPAVPG